MEQQPDTSAYWALPVDRLVAEFGTSPATSEELLERVQLALAQEIGLLIEGGVVDGPEDVDLCMITGAGWPLHLGGITPYLDQTGASERVNGKLFHPSGV